MIINQQTVSSKVRNIINLSLILAFLKHVFAEYLADMFGLDFAVYGRWQCMEFGELCIIFYQMHVSFVMIQITLSN